jgi:hypothetical protein
MDDRVALGPKMAEFLENPVGEDAGVDEEGGWKTLGLKI